MLFFFDSVVINRKPSPIESQRKSTIRIKEAVCFFTKEFNNAKDEELCQWFKVLHTAVITTFCLEGENTKMLATQIFSFQNDRGKELTTLEKIKAYLMHQIYKVDVNNAEKNISALESVFADIYTLSENLSINEDTILRYHCQAFISYSSPVFEGIKHALNNMADKDKVEWIKDFASALRRSFNFMIKIESIKNTYDSIISDVCILDISNSMPLILKLCHFYAKEGDICNEKINTPLVIVERILFKLTYTMGDYRTNNLIGIANRYNGDSNDYDWLIKRLIEIERNGFKPYWNFTGDCVRYFTDCHYHYDRKLRYILYKYENYLRKEKKVRPLIPAECTNVFHDNKNTENTLDHITPQSPSFTTYTDEFKQRWLNDMGNLSLLSWGNNTSKRNTNPADNENRNKYDGAYYSQKEIYDTLCKKGCWGQEEISARHEKLLGFILNHWKLNS